MQSLPRIDPGKRALIAGRTGSGKSTLGNWLLNRSIQHWVILNPKGTNAYKDLPESQVVTSLDLTAVEKAFKKAKYVILNPSLDDAQPAPMDAFIKRLHLSYTNIGLCCDELYTLHNHGIAGQGLLGWLTRGRELKQSFVGLTQRPAWLSQFLFSESDYICTMTLSLPKDRKRMEEMTGNKLMGERLPEHYWLWYTAKNETLRYFDPVQIDNELSPA